MFLRAYDLLQDRDEDLRGLAFAERRKRLEVFLEALDPRRFDLSPIVGYGDFAELAAPARRRRRIR